MLGLQGVRPLFLPVPTRWGDVPGCCWQVECSTSPQRTHELLVRRDVLWRERRMVVMLPAGGGAVAAGGGGGDAGGGGEEEEEEAEEE
ncbi:hypothetical protein KPH14_005142 [Odynerus spinipes]|uniref:Uncharacterized protein n=1 Tax=Odynerus spinipes TaxID=1348599 RepID=A0AAD9VNP8_9HYME|nr:hypothetical protein KPH14_005142 [Odynerus spinipes]